MSHKWVLTSALLALLGGLDGVQSPQARPGNGPENDCGLLQKETDMIRKIQRTEKEWEEVLTPEQFRVLREGGTERPFSGEYNDYYEKGVYSCGACGTPLFASETKYDHGTGWPSFTAPIDESRLELRPDRSHGMIRTEVRCAVCGSHLGHVFNDGPAPTGEHYCINSAALKFRPAGPLEAAKEERTETAIFAAGCFWGVEEKFSQIQGVVSTRVGYTGGHTKDPTYQKVCSDTTGHAESVEVVFDPAQVTYSRLLAAFFEFHDPTQINRQGPDVGSQYRSAIFFLNETQKKAALEAIARLESSGRYGRPIATQVLPATEFYPAEEYHQKYLKKLRNKK